MSILQDELTIGPLAGEIAPYLAAADDEAIADILNRKDIPAKGVVSTSEVQGYLMLHDLLLPIESGASMPCKTAGRALSVFTSFDFTRLAVLEKFTQTMDDLVADTTLAPAFTQTHKAEILALADKLISRAEQIGLNVTPLSVRLAIWNADGTRSI